MAPSNKTKSKTSVKKIKNSDKGKKVSKGKKGKKVTKDTKDTKDTKVTKVTKVTKGKKDTVAKNDTPVEKSTVISPARVKSSLMELFINKEEHDAHSEVLQAANRPVMPKPTDENPDPVMPKQGKQIPISKLSDSTKEFVKFAEEKYEETLKHAFNKCDKSEFPTFKSYCESNDNFRELDEWKRACHLINKRKTRLGTNVRDIITRYLDTIAVDYVKKALHNCRTEEKKTIKIHHVLASDENTPVVRSRNFVETFKTFNQMYDWYNETRNVSQSAKETKDATEKAEILKNMPEFPKFQYKYNFKSSVKQICDNVHTELNIDNENKISISDEFKQFVSLIINEAIERIGLFLVDYVNHAKVKTINDGMAMNSIVQIYNITGMKHDSFITELKELVQSINDKRSERKNDRINNED